MSVSSKKRKRHERYEESLGGSFPEIMVDDQHGEPYLMWVYHVAPFEVRVEIPLTEMADHCPWVYIDGDDECLSDEAAQSRAEMHYGAMTRVRLLEAHGEEIRKNATRASGLARLREAATVAGLFGTREPRRCVISTWTTHEETTDAAHAESGK